MCNMYECSNFCLLTSLVLFTTCARFYVGGHVIDKYGRNGAKLEVPAESADDNPLFLTPMIEKGEIKKAQELATVSPMLKNVHSFAGYLTVNKTTSSNLFFWFFKSQLKDWESSPIVIWLQGGPGSSSMFGLFTENGPFRVDKNLKLKRRKFSWNRKCNLVFFDNPVGTGFSFTKQDSGYAQNEVDVAKDLYEAILQLLKLFPTLQKNKLFITGESYAGKYIPAIGYKIFKSNPKASLKVNLSGLFIGNGWTDPVNQVEYSKYLYQLGLIDKNMLKKFTDLEDNIRAYIRASNFSAAEEIVDFEIDLMVNATGLRGYYDFVNDDIGSDGSEMQFINDAKTRKAIHVGNMKFNNGWETYSHLEKDIMQSVRLWIEEMLTAEKFPILYYSGQLDIIVAYPLSLGFYKALEWPRAKEYQSAKRCQFKVGKDVAGYYKTAGSFTEVLVRNTGHVVPTSQPKWAFELLDRFITNSSSFLCV